MKVITILILFMPILTINYDLVNGEKKIINSLNSSEIYYFYINAVQYQELNVSLTMSYMSNKPFTYTYIYECSNSSSSSCLQNTSQYITTTTNNNQLISSFTYSVNYSDTQYIALKFTSNYNISKFTIKIDSEFIYDLSNGVDKNITNLKSGISYYFFLPSTQLQTDIINLTMNYMSIEPFSYLYIYEYESRSSSNYINIKNQNLTMLKKNNELSSSFTYLVSSYTTKYIALKLTPIYNISYIVVNINAEGVYNLTNGVDNNVTNLKSRITYYFFLPSTKYQISFINLTMNYMSSNPFYYFDIYEYSNKSALIWQRKDYNSITTSSNNKWLSTFTYLVKDDDTKYIVLKFTFESNINYIIANFDSYKYELLNDGDKKIISNLKSGNKYYILIEMNNKRRIKVNLTMSYNYYNPLSLLYL